MATTSDLAEEIKQITGGSYAVSDEKIKSYADKINSYKSDIEQIRTAPPSSKFDSAYYLKKYPEVGPAGFGAKDHWNKYGQKEGRFANAEQELMAAGGIPEDRLGKIKEIEAKIPPLENLIPQLQTPAIRESRVPAELAFSAKNNYGASDLASKLNFQISDDQILNDVNTSRQNRISKIIQDGNAQIAGINQRLKFAESLFKNMDAKDPSRANSEAFINQLRNDLSSVTSAVTGAQDMQKNFTPITMDSPEGLKEITSFRSFVQLPEERASQQLLQIDPESYRTAVGLGQQYRQMATAPIGQTQSAQTEAFRAELEKGYRDYSKSPIGATTTAETEALRRRIEDEAMSQLSLGAQLGAEEQRQYQQAARAAQTARGNIFGVAPAVEEAVTTGRAGEERKLARYGAASQFLSSGQTTGDALARDVQLREALRQSRLGAGGQFLTSGQTMSDALRGDIAFRDALQQNRMGAAANFVAGGPSVYNLAQARTAGQQNAFQNYIQANQALPGGFNQQPSTAAPFYQTVDQNIPVALTQAFNDLYRSQSNYQASTYGAQVGAIASQPSGAQQFGQIATGIGNLFSPFKFG